MREQLLNLLTLQNCDVKVREIEAAAVQRAVDDRLGKRGVARRDRDDAIRARDRLHAAEIAVVRMRARRRRRPRQDRVRRELEELGVSARAAAAELSRLQANLDVAYIDDTYPFLLPHERDLFLGALQASGLLQM